LTYSTAARSASHTWKIPIEIAQNVRFNFKVRLSINQLQNEIDLARKCRQGDVTALSHLRERCHSDLIRILRSRGATSTETDDLLADLWADCVPGADDQPSLLEKFAGGCSLQSWLATVLTRRWIDLRRKHARRPEVSHASGDGDSRDDVFQRLPAPDTSESESVLVELLQESLKAAFAKCPAEPMVLLRLRYMHGVSQRELARMLGCHETKISRTLSAAMEEIEKATLRELNRRDPWLQLQWQDLVDMCNIREIAFL
jgi:RNA polymerase sigma factor (sigma-70 family)